MGLQVATLLLDGPETAGSKGPVAGEFGHRDLQECLDLPPVVRQDPAGPVCERPVAGHAANGAGLRVVAHVFQFQGGRKFAAQKRLVVRAGDGHR